MSATKKLIVQCLLFSDDDTHPPGPAREVPLFTGSQTHSRILQRGSSAGVGHFDPLQTRKTGPGQNGFYYGITLRLKEHEMPNKESMNSIIASAFTTTTASTFSTTQSTAEQPAADAAVATEDIPMHRLPQGGTSAILQGNITPSQPPLKSLSEQSTSSNKLHLTAAPSMSQPSSPEVNSCWSHITHEHNPSNNLSLNAITCGYRFVVKVLLTAERSSGLYAPQPSPASTQTAVLGYGKTSPSESSDVFVGKGVYSVPGVWVDNSVC
jgi:hypothetical protein